MTWQHYLLHLTILCTSLLTVILQLCVTRMQRAFDCVHCYVIPETGCLSSEQYNNQVNSLWSNPILQRSFLGVKRPWREAEHSLPSVANTEIKTNLQSIKHNIYIVLKGTNSNMFWLTKLPSLGSTCDKINSKMLQLQFCSDELSSLTLFQFFMHI